MPFSEDIQLILQALNEESGGKLRKENDMGVLLESIANKLDHDLLNRIVFTGKSLWKIAETLRRAGASNDSTDNLQNELMRHIEDLRAFIYQVMKDHPESASISRFEVIYLEATQGCIRNLIDLAHDLAVLKNLQG